MIHVIGARLGESVGWSGPAFVKALRSRTGVGLVGERLGAVRGPLRPHLVEGHLVASVEGFAGQANLSRPEPASLSWKGRRGEGLLGGSFQVSVPQWLGWCGRWLCERPSLVSSRTVLSLIFGSLEHTPCLLPWGLGREGVLGLPIRYLCQVTASLPESARWPDLT